MAFSGRWSVARGQDGLTTEHRPPITVYSVLRMMSMRYASMVSSTLMSS
jgi:hypothetical protein